MSIAENATRMSERTVLTSAAIAEISIESSGYDYLEDVLDTQYIADEDRNYLGARVLVAFGGPNIWINTQTKTIEAYWWEDKAFAYYENDEMGINDVLAERWEVAA